MREGESKEGSGGGREGGRERGREGGKGTRKVPLFQAAPAAL